MIFRKATIDDLEILMKLRLQQLMEEGQEPRIDIEEELKSFFVEQIASNQFVHTFEKYYSPKGKLSCG